MRHMLKAMYGLDSFARYKEPAWFYGGDIINADLENDVVFCKTHARALAYDERYKAIYIIRDGRDAIVSHAHFLQDTMEDTRPLVDIMHLLIEGKYPAYDETDYHFNWSKHVEAWLKRTQTTSVLRFEELIKKPLEIIPKVMANLGLDLEPNPDAVAPSFEVLHEAMPGMFRKGQIGAYKEEMPADLEALFWQKHGKVMTHLGYTGLELAV